MTGLDLDDADKLDDLADRTMRAVKTAEGISTDDRTEKRLLSQVRLYGEDLARSARELADHVRADH
ncbi:MAG TPA: hypothetical protein VGI66_17920 [Streptosporangiaceae bacterium]|jgi:hypothetical protein